MNTNDPTIFSVEQAKALCGGTFTEGYAWDRVEFFKLGEGSMLHPYTIHGIVPMPSLRLHASFTVPYPTWMIQGFFFHEHNNGGRTDYDLRIEGIESMRYNLPDLGMFQGMFGLHPDQSRMHGRITDRYGESSIYDIELDEEIGFFSFTKLYLRRDTPIMYEFQRFKDRSWHGFYISKQTGKGPTNCVLTPVYASFQYPPNEE